MTTGCHESMPLKRDCFESVVPAAPADLAPSRDDFEVVGVFNPGAVRVDGEVVLLVRVAERPREARPGFTGLPRWGNHGELTVDWVPDDELEPVDPRVVRRKADGLVRLTFTSHLRVVRCGDGRSVEEVTDVAFRPRLGAGGVRRRGPADHAAGRPVLLHLRGRLAARRGDGPGLDGRLPRLRAARRHLLLREQGRGPVPRAGRRGVRGPAPAQPGDAVQPARDVGRLVART